MTASAAATPAAVASAVKSQAIPKLLPRFFHQFVGNGRLFRCLKPYESNVVIAYLNSVYNMAPVCKWGLSVVPMYGVFVGKPPVEKIDLSTSGALACTGFIWTFYALMIQPQNSGSRALALVNFCMGSVNGYNAYRKYTHDVRVAAAAKQ